MSISMTQATAARRPTKAWWKELWVQVMVAMALGIALGVWRPDLGAQMQPFGDAFIKAIRMLIAPIIFCTVVNGIAHMADMAKVGRVAIKAIVYFEVATTVAFTLLPLRSTTSCACARLSCFSSAARSSADGAPSTTLHATIRPADGIV